MQHTLLAVFDNRGDAQKALDELAACGFARQQLRLSEGDAAGQADAAVPDEVAGVGASIRHFFTDIFGTDRSEHAQLYADAVSSGRYVLSLNADSEPEVERAAEIVERFGPVDIDEHASQWAGQDSARMGAVQHSAPMSQQRADHTAIPVIQEELRVGKREVQRGGVRVVRRVVETPVTERVDLREEHVNVERRPVDRPASAADINAFEETTIELRETAEEAVIEKSARVVEEVVVGKRVDERSEKISGSVRRTEVEIERLDPVDDAYFRGHWTSNYANEGGAYEDYAPAYSYGSTMARSDLYRGRSWDDAEGGLRGDWEARYPQSGWEKFKAAVRHGWERITS
jgi:uncharacterized protein (TIGR02271 family)